MKVKPGTTACPHCGGRSGFFTSIVFAATRTCGWDGADTDTDGYTVKSETNPRCMDCGKSVRSVTTVNLPAPDTRTNERQADSESEDR